MRWLRAFLVRLAGSFARERRECEFAEEIEAHLQMEIEDRIRTGMTPDEARRAALIHSGGLESAKEAWRDRRGLLWLGTLLQDCRYALRLIAKSRAYSLFVVVALALVIGANTAIFSLVKGVFLKPLPGVKAAADITIVASKTAGGRVITLSHPDYRFLRDHNTTFAGFVASAILPCSLALGQKAERVWGELVSGNYFQTLDVKARLGRTLLPSDATPGAPPVAVISHGLWEKMFASDPQIVGKTIRVNAHPVVIAGVAELGFRGSMAGVVLDIYVPLTMQPELTQWGNVLNDSRTQWLITFGRRKPGVTLSATQSEMRVLGAQLSKNGPQEEIDNRAIAIPMWQSPFGAQSFLLPMVSTLEFVVGLMLLIACANIANLVLARSVSRRKEGSRFPPGARWKPQPHRAPLLPGEPDPFVVWRGNRNVRGSVAAGSYRFGAASHAVPRRSRYVG
jgi:hypothetical protein